MGNTMDEEITLFAQWNSPANGGSGGPVVRWFGGRWDGVGARSGRIGDLG